MTTPDKNMSWTLGTILDWSKNYLSEKGMETPRLDAEVLISKALSCSRIQLYTNYHKPLNKEEREKIRELLLRRASWEPVAYIVGEREFFSRTFLVNSATLIPRPDSETLIEEGVKFLKEPSSGECSRVLDIGTGSGCLGVTLALEASDVSVDLLDVSSEALSVAEENVVRLQARNIGQIICEDIFKWTEKKPDAYDLIVSNPPYISRSEAADLSPEVLNFEPHVALFGETDGLAFYEFFANQLQKILNPGGRLILEMGAFQSHEIRPIFEDTGHWQNISIIKDLAGHDRVLCADLTSDR